MSPSPNTDKRESGPPIPEGFTEGTRTVPHGSSYEPGAMWKRGQLLMDTVHGATPKKVDNSITAKDVIQNKEVQEEENSGKDDTYVMSSFSDIMEELGDIKSFNQSSLEMIMTSVEELSKVRMESLKSEIVNNISKIERRNTR